MIVRNLSPILPVADFDAAIAFLQECLGFEVQYRDQSHVYCNRDQAAVRLTKAPPDADMDDPARQLIIYLDVEDVDAYFAAYKDSLTALPSGHFRPPFDQSYGQREFHAIHGPFLFMAGQPIAEPT